MSVNANNPAQVEQVEHELPLLLSLVYFTHVVEDLRVYFDKEVQHFAFPYACTSQQSWHRLLKLYFNKPNKQSKSGNYKEMILNDD